MAFLSKHILFLAASTPTWVRVGAVALGVSFFGAHVFLAVMGVRRATNRDDRLEAAGLLVPGLAGLLLAAAYLSPTAALSLTLVLAALPVMIVGRAIYELLVFRPRR